MNENIKYSDEDLKDHHGVSAVIRDNTDRILMQEHVKYGFWTIPVGKVLEGQSIEDGLKQEVFEETGLVVEDCKEILYKEIEYIRKGLPVKVFTHTFEIIKYSGVPENREPNKHKQQSFMTVEEVMDLPFISDTTIMFLETLGKKRPNRISLK